MPRGSTSSLYKSSYLTKLCDDFGGNALGNKCLDHIADLDVPVVRDGDAALHAIAHFTGVIFEAPQRANLASKDHDIVAQQADLGIALDDAVGNSATRHSSDFRDTESLQYVGTALVRFFNCGLEQAGHGALHLVLQFVNDRMQSDIDFFLLSEFLGLAFRANIEAYNDGIGRGCEQNIALRYGANSGSQHFQAD